MASENKLPSSRDCFYIWPPGSGKIVRGRSEAFARTLIDDKIWKNFDKEMTKIRKKEAKNKGPKNNPATSAATKVKIISPQTAKKRTGDVKVVQRRRNGRYNLRAPSDRTMPVSYNEDILSPSSQGQNLSDSSD